MTQKGDPYTKLFNTSSEVIMMSCILSQLNILRNNLIKPYFTKIWSNNSVFNFIAVTYTLHKCSETILWFKRQFTVHVLPVSSALKFTEARKTCHRVVGNSIWSFIYSGDLYSKNCIVKTSETLIVWRAYCYTAGSDKSDAIEGVPDKLLKGAAMVFRVHSRYYELLLTYWCSQSTMIFNFEATACNNWMSWLN